MGVDFGANAVAKRVLFSAFFGLVAAALFVEPITAALNVIL
jgi:hypothetical protein